MQLFGSALRDDFDPDRSDIDLLVEFQLPGVNYVGGRAYLIVAEQFSVIHSGFGSQKVVSRSRAPCRTRTI